MFLPILAADFLEVLLKGIPFLLFIFWGLQQVFSERQKQAKAAAQKARRKEAVPNPAAGKTEVEDEIDAFLRRAAQKKQQQQNEPTADKPTRVLRPAPRERAPLPSQVEKPVVLVPRNEPRSAGNVGRRRSASGKPAARHGQSTVSPKRESVAEHVRSRFSQHDLATTTELGESVGQADDKMEAHLRSVFDHKLGNLRRKVQEAPQQKQQENSLAQSLVSMLQTPQGIRQMVVINEVLRRPEI